MNATLVGRGCEVQGSWCIEYAIDNSLGYPLFCEDNPIAKNSSCQCGAFVYRRDPLNRHGHATCEDSTIIKMLGNIPVITLVTVASIYSIRCFLGLVFIARETITDLQRETQESSMSSVKLPAVSTQTNTTARRKFRKRQVRRSSGAELRLASILTFGLNGVSFVTLLSWSVMYLLTIHTRNPELVHIYYDSYRKVGTISNITSVVTSISVSIVMLNVIGSLAELSYPAKIVKVVAAVGNVVYFIFVISSRGAGVAQKIGSGIISCIMVAAFATSYFESKRLFKRYGNNIEPVKSGSITDMADTVNADATKKALKRIKTFILKFSAGYVLFFVLQSGIPRHWGVGISLALLPICYSQTLVFSYNERASGIELTDVFPCLERRRKVQPSHKKPIQTTNLNPESDCGTLCS